MTDTIRVWTRRELEEAVAIDVPEGRTMIRCSISPKMLLTLIDYAESTGSQRVEVLSAYGDPNACELRFFKRDAP